MWRLLNSLKIWCFFTFCFTRKKKQYIGGFKVRFNARKKTPYRIGRISFDYRPSLPVIYDLMVHY